MGPQQQKMRAPVAPDALTWNSSCGFWGRLPSNIKVDDRDPAIEVWITPGRGTNR